MSRPKPTKHVRPRIDGLGGLAGSLGCSGCFGGKPSQGGFGRQMVFTSSFEQVWRRHLGVSLGVEGRVLTKMDPSMVF